MVKRKLDARAEEYIFIGYPDNTKGYRLWKCKENKFTVSRDVEFDESVFPCKVRQERAEDQQTEIGKDIFLYFNTEDCDRDQSCANGITK